MFTGYQLLLILRDSFTGWLKNFPQKGEKAQEVANMFLKELMPSLSYQDPYKVTMVQFLEHALTHK